MLMPYPHATLLMRQATEQRHHAQRPCSQYHRAEAWLPADTSDDNAVGTASQVFVFLSSYPIIHIKTDLLNPKGQLFSFFFVYT